MKNYYFLTLIMSIVAFVCWITVFPVGLIGSSPLVFAAKLIGMLTISGCIGFTAGTSLGKLKDNREFKKDLNRLH